MPAPMSGLLPPPTGVLPTLPMPPNPPTAVLPTPVSTQPLTQGMCH